MSFGDVIWFIIVSFAFIAYLIVLFSIVGDLFRDKDLGGWGKALWILFLIFAPFLTALVYLIVRGKGMGERQARTVAEVRDQQDSYIRNVAGTSPADQIATAKQLLDSGSISQAEFDQLKAKALQSAS